MITTHSLRRRILSSAIACLLPYAQAYANPTAPHVVEGSASFANQGATLNVTNSNGAVINWHSFSINNGETTRFIQPSADSSVLNRVTGPDPSQLLGALSSNGHVFLVNPSGILVGEGAKIDVAGFVATNLNFSTENFKAGNLKFEAAANSTGSVENLGEIRTPNGGSVYLVGTEVSNQGIIQSPQGEIILAAGQTVEIHDTSTPGVSVAVTGSNNQTTNLGQVVAASGQIGVIGAVVKNSGVINANQIVTDESGRIFLKASGDLSIASGSRISADASSGIDKPAAGAISLESGQGNIAVEKDAVITANGPQGGDIQINAPQGATHLAGDIQATGASGPGGSISGNAATQTIAAAAKLDVSGKTAGGHINLSSSVGPLNLENGAQLKAQGGQGGGVSLSAHQDAINQAALIQVQGTLQNGGQVQLQAATAINNQGDIHAEGRQNGGQISEQAAQIQQSGLLNADGQINGGGIQLTAVTAISQYAASTLSAQGYNGQGGGISITSLTVAAAAFTAASGGKPVAPPGPTPGAPIPSQTLISGNIRVNGRRGGGISITGDHVGLLDNANLEANGQENAGSIKIGGGAHGQDSNLANAQATYVASGVSLSANGGVAANGISGTGDGGQIVVWSEQATRVYGTLSAGAGLLGGNGGFIETSGHWLDTSGIQINASAPKGQSGVWLLDPYDLTVVSSASSTATESAQVSGIWTAGANGSTVLNTDIQNRLNNGISVILQTGGTKNDGVIGNGDITINSSIAKIQGFDASLTLSALNNIFINNDISSTNGKLNLTLNPGLNGTSIISYAAIGLNGGILSYNKGLTLDTGSQIQGSVLSTADGSVLMSNTAMLDGVTIASNLILSDTGTLVIANSLTLQNGVKLNIGAADLNFQSYNSTQDLKVSSGSATLTLAGGTIENGGLSGNGQTLIIDQGVILSGYGTLSNVNANDNIVNYGAIMANTPGQALSLNAGNFTNYGTLTVNGGEMDINSATWTNSSTFTEIAGVLNLGGNFTTAGLGVIKRTSGDINITGTLDNTGTANNPGTLDIGSAVFGNNGLTGLSGVISGGLLISKDGTLLHSNIGTLDGVTIASNLTLSNASYLVIADSLTLQNGVKLSIGAAGLNFQSYNSIQDIKVSSGSAKLALAGGSIENNSLSVTGQTLTIDKNITLSGYGSLSNVNANDSIVNNGAITADTADQTLLITAGKFTNNGTLNVHGGELDIYSNTWSNSGAFTETAGLLNLGGTFTTADLVNRITRSGGDINITGTLNNTGTLDIGSAVFDKNGLTSLSGVISGGSLTSTDGTALNSNIGMLDGVTIASNLTLSNNSYLRIINGLTLQSGIALNIGTADLNFQSSDSAQHIKVSSGSATLTMAGGTIENNGLSNNGQPPAQTLTIDQGVTLSGYGTLSNVNAKDSIVNSGTITANTPGQTLSFLIGSSSTGNFTNSGNLSTANGGTLSIGNGTIFINSGTLTVNNGGELDINSSSWTNTGTLNVTGGTVNLAANTWTNSGTLTESAGILNLGGTFTTADLVNRITRSGGDIIITGTLNNTGTLDIGSAVFGKNGLTSLSGVISGGSLTSTDGTVLNSNIGMLDGVTIASNLTLSNSSYLVIAHGLTLQNGVTLNIGAAGLNFQSSDSAQDIKVSSGSATLTMAGGAIENNGLSINGKTPTGQTLTIDQGVTLSGYGKLSNVNAKDIIVNNGILAPGAVDGSSIGTITLNGNYTQGSAGALYIAINSPSAGNYDVLAVTGTATLGGTLKLTGQGDTGSYPVLTAATVSGQFANIAQTGLSATPVYTTGNVSLTISPSTPSVPSGPTDNGSDIWTGGGNDNLWTNAKNWSNGLLPSNIDIVTIGSLASPVILNVGNQAVKGLTSLADFILSGGASLSIGSGNGVFNSLTLSGGTLGGTGNITVNGAFNVTATSTISGTGTLTTNGATQINTGGNGFLYVNGGETWLNQAALTLAGNDAISFGDGGNTLTNANAGVFNLSSSSATPLTASTAGNTFNNVGTLNLTASGLHNIDSSLTFNNSGKVNVNAGTLSIGGSGTDSGIYSVNSGSTLNFSGGARTLNAGSNITGRGTLTVSGATVNVNNLLSIANTGAAINISGGALNLGPGSVAGTLVPLSISGGNLNLNTGNILSFSSMTVSGNGKLEDSDAFSLAGDFNWSGGSLTDSHGVTINGALNISNSVNLDSDLTVKGAVNQSGILNLTKNAIFHANSFTNLGSLTGNGTIDVGRGKLTNQGTLSPGNSPGSITVLGDLLLGANSKLVIQLYDTTKGSFDTLLVKGKAVLGGELDVFGNASGTVRLGAYPVLSAATLSGTFSKTVNPPGQPAVSINYGENVLKLISQNQETTTGQNQENPSGNNPQDNIDTTRQQVANPNIPANQTPLPSLSGTPASDANAKTGGGPTVTDPSGTIGGGQGQFGGNSGSSSVSFGLVPGNKDKSDSGDSQTKNKSNAVTKKKSNCR